MKTIPLFISLVALFLLSGLGQAEQNVYFGGGVGQSFVQTEVSDIQNPDLKLNENGFAYKLLAGAKMGRILALEGGYRSFGTVKSKIADVNFESNITAYDLHAVGNLDLGILWLFAKGGVVFWDQRNMIEDAEASASGSAFSWGMGVTLKLGVMGVRAEWERFELKSFDRLSMLTLGLVFGL